ncbi:MAG: hypothetical protein AAB353_00610 [Candidatus Hydrogenedentota bacterium]
MTKEHPSEARLFEYAEALLDGGPLPKALGGHVAACSVCRARVESVRASLAYAGNSRELEPSREMTARILLTARNERRRNDARAMRQVVLRRASKVAGVAAFAIVATLTYRSVMSAPALAQAPAIVEQTAASTVDSTVFADRVATLSASSAEETVLSGAVMASYWQPRRPLEKAQLRAVKELEDDISEALEAVQENPGLARAASVVSSARQRRADTMKALFVARSL